MFDKSAAPVARFTVVTLGVTDMRASITFYDALGFARKMQATGENVAFFDTGGTVLALYPWAMLARDAGLSESQPGPGFFGQTLAWNCRSETEVDEVLLWAAAKGAVLRKPAHRTEYGGYAGYFTDPDGHLWEVVVAPGVEVGDDGRVHLAD